MRQIGFMRPTICAICLVAGGYLLAVGRYGDAGPLLAWGGLYLLVMALAIRHYRRAS